MAELLILNHGSWMAALDDKQLASYVEKYPKFMMKYNARQQKGDIVDIKPDGHWTGKDRGYDKANFDVVIVKGATVEELRAKYSGPLEKENLILEFDEAAIEHKMVNYPIMEKKFRANIATYTDKAEIAESIISVKTVSVEVVEETP